MSTPKKKSVSQSPRSSVKKNCPPPRTRQPASPRAIVTTSAQRQQPALDAATREEAERVGERERIKRIHRLGDRPIEDEGLEDVREKVGIPEPTRPQSTEGQDRQEAHELAFPEPWRKVLANNSGAIEANRDCLSYQSTIWTCMFRDALFSESNITKFKTARDKGIPPEEVVYLCCLFSERKKISNQLLTGLEAKRYASELRKMARSLRSTFPRLIIGFPSVMKPKREPSLQHSFLDSSAPSFLVGGTASLCPPSTLRTLVAAAGNPTSLGALDELAERLEANVPLLAVMRPSNRPQQLDKKMFAWAWERLARERTNSPCDELGAWFLQITFSKTSGDYESKTYDVKAFRQLRKRMASQIARVSPANPSPATNTASVE